LFGQSVYVDQHLAGPGDIVFSGGSHTDAVRVAYDDFVRVVRPTVGDFSTERRPWH
jgi:Ala-tRNA(Pro) deacylase